MKKRVLCGCAAAVVFLCMNGCGANDNTAPTANLMGATAGTTAPSTEAAAEQTGTTQAESTIATTTEPSTTAVLTTKKPFAPSSTIKTTVTTTKRTTTTTKRTTTTTKRPATTIPSGSGKTPHEISTAGITSKMSGARVLRAWRIASGATSVQVEKLSYGSNINATYQGKSYSVPQICFIALVTCKPENFRSTCAKLTFNKDEALTNDMAKSVGALIAINNESYTGHWSETKSAAFIADFPVVKEGKVVQNPSASGKCYAVYKDGTWVQNLSLGPANVNAEISKGLSFTEGNSATPVVWPGFSRRRDTYEVQNVLLGDGTDALRNRTLVAQIDTTHYLLMVGEFMRWKTMIDILQAYGATKIIRCNGGNCSYMYLKGVGNVTQSKGPSIVNLDKLNLLESEWKYRNGYLKNGAQGGPCPAIDIIYVK